MVDPLLAYAGVSATPKAPKQPKEDRTSLARTIAGHVLSPLAAVGNILDLPASSVRDALTGNNPFDQYLTPTREDNRTSGRDVLTHYGLTTPNDPHRWELSDVGGFLTEVATDPLTLVSGVGKGLGTALKGTGKASELFKFAGMPVGKMAANLIDKGAAKAWQLGPLDKLGRGTAALFDPSTMGRYSAGEQKIARGITGRLENGVPDASLNAIQDVQNLAPVQDAFKAEYGHLAPADQGKAFDKIVQHAQETAGAGRDFGGAFHEAATRFGGKAPSDALRQMAEGPIGELHASRLADYNLALSKGVKIGNVEGQHILHAPTQASQKFVAAKAREEKLGGLMGMDFTESRKPILRGIPQMEKEAMAANPAKYGGPNGYKAIDAEFGKYLGYTGKGGKTVTPLTHAQKLSKWVDSVADLKGGKQSFEEVYQVNPGGLHRSYKEQLAKINATADEVHSTLLDATTPRGLSAERAFQKLGMDATEAQNHLAKLTGKSIDEIATLKFDPKVVKNIQNVLRASKNPEWLGILGSVVDKFNKAFKGAVTVPFPSFHIRNLLSGQHLNLSELRGPTDYANYGKNIAKAWGMMKEGEKNPLIQKAMAEGLISSKMGSEATGIAFQAGLDNHVLNPFQGVPAAYKQAGAAQAEAPGNALTNMIPGKLRQAAATPFHYGSNVAQATEYMNRVPMWMTLMDKGMSARDAAKVVNRLQVRYDLATPFEKNVMRRLIPFYGFSRGITPQIASMLAERPGGKVAQTIRASGAGRNEGEVLPPHLADTAAIPLGEKPDGSKSYLSGFGLAHEAALPYLATPLDAKGALLNAAASTTPLVKFPAELATGQTFFQRGPNGGRPLKELDPTIGRTMSNAMGGDTPVNWLGGNREATRFAEHLASNSPASKLLTTARTLSDPRKSVLERATNVLSPVKTTDVSPQQQKRSMIDAANALADAMGAGTYSDRFFTEKQIKAAAHDNPLLAAQMRQLKQLFADAKKAGRTGKKKARGGNPPARAEANALVRAAGV